MRLSERVRFLETRTNKDDDIIQELIERGLQKRRARGDMTGPPDRPTKAQAISFFISSQDPSMGD